jgi:hypothetical protein
MRSEADPDERLMGLRPFEEKRAAYDYTTEIDLGNTITSIAVLGMG